MTGASEEMFSQSHIATGQDAAASSSSNPPSAFIAYDTSSCFCVFMVTIYCLNPNSQFGILAAVWRFLAGQDLKAF